MLPRSWEKSFECTVVIPAKMRFCEEFSKTKCCDRCNNQINENMEFEVNRTLLGRQAPIDIGRMLPFFKV